MTETTIRKKRSAWSYLKFVGPALAIYLALVAGAYFHFAHNTHGYDFGSLPVTFAVEGLWFIVCLGVAVELMTRLEKRPNFRNEIVIALLVAFLAWGMRSMDRLHETMTVMQAESDAYLSGYAHGIKALDEAGKTPADIDQIKKRFSKSLFREMYEKGGFDKEYLDSTCGSSC